MNLPGIIIRCKRSLELIGKIIPGYAGYADRDDRRETDRLLRSQLAQSLNELKQTINNIELELTDLHKTHLLNGLGRIDIKLEMIVDKIKYASYGASGFFDIIQINDSALDKLYKFDLSLKGYLDSLAKHINSLRIKIADADYSISADIKDIVNRLDELNKHIDGRSTVIVST